MIDRSKLPTLLAVASIVLQGPAVIYLSAGGVYRTTGGDLTFVQYHGLAPALLFFAMYLVYPMAAVILSANRAWRYAKIAISCCSALLLLSAVAWLMSGIGLLYLPSAAALVGCAVFMPRLNFGHGMEPQAK